ncbi:MAG: DNA repair protein RadA [Gammaproteobacteria bacterium]
MAKSKRQYQCQQCGAMHSKWAGQCGECGEWNALVETVAAATTSPQYKGYSGEQSSVQPLSEIIAEELPRTSSGIKELDRVLGGGIVAGSVVLIGGDPGIGKSTLLLQSLASFNTPDAMRTLYVSGEESASQIALRAERLKLKADDLRLLTETDVDKVIATANAEQAKLMVVDSIQTIFTADLQSAPGSVAQVRECAQRLVRFAKSSSTAVYLVGHVTKDGAIAGPRVLEHMVDAVLYFEGDQAERYRLVRAVKNRFGAVNELGVFAMTDLGLREVSNPSAIWLSRHEQPVAGSVVMVSREGTRPLLVEVQALADESVLNNPRRVTIGLEHNRLSMLLAVLNRHAGVSTAGCDVFANVVGGVRITETGVDLPILAAIVSSLRDKPVNRDTAIFGEVGLAGEIRPVQAGEERLREAAKHGFKQAIVPQANAPKATIKGMEVLPVVRLSDALEQI